MRPNPTFVAASTLVLAVTAAAQAPVAARRPVDLAICLDTSGSMQGLIDSARQSIWAIVNDLALAKPAPKLRLALLTFGNDGHTPASGWVEVQTPFTEDLDLVSQKLFALTTNGGTELVGRVLQASLDKLDWTPDSQALKMIVVAGNEGADQDKEVDFKAMCKRAIERGIVVNSIYCGDANDQLAPVWREVASLADGRFHAIDQHATVVVATPFDAQLQVLSAKVNETYLPYGKEGTRAWANQAEQDKNASGMNPQAAAQRAACKVSDNYYNATWDLVDACRDKKVKLEDLPADQLPEAMRKMTVEERKKHVADMQAKRGEVQKQVQELNQKRDAYVADEMKKKAIDASKSFDHGVRQAVRDQAKAKGLVIEDPKPATENGGAAPTGR